MATDVFPAPTNCGKRLLSHVIDEKAQSGHERPFASIARTTNPADGYRDVSYALFANAINRCARWLLDNVGLPTRQCEPLVYLASADLRYHILIMAAVKAGFMVTLFSPRNSAEAFAALLEESGADNLITDEKPSPGGALIMKSKPDVRRFTIPFLDDLLDSEPVPVIALDATWEEYRFRPLLQIHSSGSTGIPKLFTIKHGTFTAFDAFQLLETNELYHRVGNMRNFVTLPPFHVAGLAYGLAAPCYMDSTVVLAPPVPLNADLTDTIHTQAKVDFSTLPPSIVTDLAKNESYLQNISGLKGIMFSGGPLGAASGNLVASRTRLFAGYGASEWLGVPQFPKPAEDWPYFNFNIKQGGLEFRQRDEGLYEMCIVRSPKYELSQPVFVTLPDIDEFCSKDLFSKHPTKPGLWKYESRSDDILVFSNGEKLNPVTFEGLVTTSPDVSGCVVIGQGRFQAALLVELTKDQQSTDREKLLEKIWPFVQRANQPTVQHGRVAKDMMFFTAQDKPLPRAGKGTIQRASANKLYAPEIDQFYAMASNTRTTWAATKVDLSNTYATRKSLAAFLRDVLFLDDVEDFDDFFVVGMDSLQLINLVRAINASRPNDPVDAKLIYENPSIEQLSLRLHEESVPKHEYSNDSEDEELQEAWLSMDKMYKDLASQSDGARRKKRTFKGQIRSEETGPVLPLDTGWLAWSQVLSMFLVNVNNWGLVNSFGVFQAFYKAKFLASYSTSAISWVGTVQGALLLLVGVVSGPLFDAGYFKPTLVVGSVGLVFSLMMLSLSTEYYQIMLSQGVLLGICEGLLYIPSIALVPVYFRDRRGLALGLSTGGGSVGGVLYPIIFNQLLREVGFGWAVRVIGFIALVTLGIAVVLSKPLGRRSARQLLDRSALQDASYVAYMGAAFLLLAGVFVPFFLASTYSLEQLHTSPSLSFYAIAILNSAQFFGRLLPLWASDFKSGHLGPEAWYTIGNLALGILAFGWIGIRNVGGWIPWLLLYGFFSGSSITMPAVVLPHICPNMAAYGTRLGMLYAVAGLGLLISTPVAGAANAASGGFLGSQLWTGAVCVASSLFGAIMSVEARKRRMLYEMGRRGRKDKRRKRLARRG